MTRGSTWLCAHAHLRTCALAHMRTNKISTKIAKNHIISIKKRKNRNILSVPIFLCVHAQRSKKSQPLEL
jgi:hypothetical protein